MDLTQQYQQLADEQKKQLSKFVCSKLSLFNNFTSALLHLNELVKSVESDMASMKSLLQSHLRKVKGDVNALQDAQERMAKDLLATKSSCKEELL